MKEDTCRRVVYGVYRIAIDDMRNARSKQRKQAIIDGFSAWKDYVAETLEDENEKMFFEDECEVALKILESRL